MLHALYLIFNEGYAGSIGANLQRADLASEAIASHDLYTRNCRTTLKRRACSH